MKSRYALNHKLKCALKKADLLTDINFLKIVSLITVSPI